MREVGGGCEGIREARYSTELQLFDCGYFSCPFFFTFSGTFHTHVHTYKIEIHT